jgi:hypothetical protein
VPRCGGVRPLGLHSGDADAIRNVVEAGRYED